MMPHRLSINWMNLVNSIMWNIRSLMICPITRTMMIRIILKSSSETWPKPKYVEAWKPPEIPTTTVMEMEMEIIQKIDTQISEYPITLPILAMTSLKNPQLNKPHLKNNLSTINKALPNKIKSPCNSPSTKDLPLHQDNRIPVWG